MSYRNRSPKRRRKTLFIAFLVLVVVGVPLVVFIGKWANSSSEQTIVIANDTKSVKPTVDQSLQTVYFKTMVPAQWRIQKTTDQTNPNRLHVVGLAPAGSSGQIGITSDLLPSDQLNGVADYHLRTSDPAQYATFSDAGFPAGAVGFKNTSGAPVYTVFMTHSGRYASITVSDEPSDEQSVALLKTLVTQWSWLP